MRSNTFVNTQQTNKQQGFTLIELVVVIVILGILAVTAAPKFIDLTSDARASVVEGLKGSINSAADMAHAKALVSGQTGGTGAISAAGSTINLVNGWPAEASINDLINLDTDADIAEVSGSAGTYQYSTATTPASCQVVYTETSDVNVRPSVVATITGC
jgi:MSHA pilin protein MshA